MEPSKIKDMGEAIRRVRKSKGLRLEDLADENISPATISNIERGIAHVNLAKIQYLLEKLDVNMEEIPDILSEQEEESNEIKFNLLTTDVLIDLGNPKDAMTRLDNMKLEDNHPCAAYVQHLKGKAFLSMKKWNRAERCYGLAISLSHQNQNKDNLEATSYLDLSLCFYQQNEIEKALDFVESGLDAFIDGNGRGSIKYTLIRNKVVYLIRLGRNMEALRAIQDIWEEMDKIEDVETVLAFYVARADLLRKTGMIDEAIQYAVKGLELAKTNKDFQNIFHILIVLGRLYTAKGKWQQAENCFNTGLTSQHLLTSETYLTDAYAGYGILLSHQNRKDEAKKMFEKAIINAEKHDNAPKLTYALRVMGDFWKSSGTKLEAIPYYERALEVAQKFHYKQAEYKLYYRLSQCYQDSDQKEFEKCLLNMYKTQKALRGEENEILEDE
ncbi:helix-turn-helix transcriptional regulator [Marininema halotolerans]|uniref:Tetratricopeptide repeat-containing protein n=1 Tax=Marininema halotolerans TaxID=1155944 RepID=A0A1I6RMC3_9BACL|nr:helix-turn-helix transcriptional regulator [Marininema halotolerans]SFS65796.1 Tetratricopeptide repeat-containing protein [Marininema halotolerans]